MTWVFASDAPPPGSAEERVLLLGGKAANLATMAVDLGLPVPPAFTISTEACRATSPSGWPEGLDGEVRAAMAALEAKVGRRFGDRGRPAARLVRSGAPRSMPGMMDTILNLGLNEETGRAWRGPPAMRRSRPTACGGSGSNTHRSWVPRRPGPVGPAARAIEAVFRSWRASGPGPIDGPRGSPTTSARA